MSVLFQLIFLEKYKEDLSVNRYEPFPFIISGSLSQLAEHRLFRLKLESDCTLENSRCQRVSFFSPGFPMKGGHA